ncbi:MAG: 1-acyl-sn-glycerol-3-phosphate acyltransferase/MFS family permease [Verrucomicrobia bacterium]|nr:MAG: 1-acyl-sn-glycerol-3-phosphate acyltransferase/MFS family permease [Verrucomicrobiota bacterium]
MKSGPVGEQSDGARGGRREPAWRSLWYVVENQAHNAFNDKVAQFILLAVSEVVAASRWYPQIVSVLLVLPQLFLAPVAGWLADHESKRRVLIWCSAVQVVVLGGVAAAFAAGWFWVATALFFVLAVQAAVYGPAKSGIVKELVGERHLTTASGWMQVTMIAAFACGQLLGGKAFEYGHDEVFGGDVWRAAAVPVFLLAVVAVVPLVLVFRVERTPVHGEGRFHRGLWTEHFRHLDDLMAVRRVRLTALGVSFFWLAATMLTLMLIALAAEIEPNKASRAALSSEFLGLVALGVAAGSLLTGKLSANRIELGLVPIGGVGMAVAGLVGSVAEPGGVWFGVAVLVLGACSALFMVPLHASLQDQVEPRVRGRMLSAAGLMDSLAMMVGIALQFVLMRAGLGIRWQFAVLAVLCLGVSVYVLRIIPQSFVRFLVVGLIRVVYRIRLVHPERVRESGPALLLSNHVSYIDGLVLSAACDRPVRFAAFGQFFENPVFALVLRTFGVVPISRTRAKDGIVKMAEILRGGGVACVFPEGQLTRTGMMNGIRGGFELIARRGGGPVVPVYMDDLWGSVFSSGGGRLLRRHPHHFPYHVSVMFGEPMRPEEANAGRLREAMQGLAAEALAGRGEVLRGMVRSVAGALGRQPWLTAVMVGDGSGRRLRRGELLARGMQLARRWEGLPRERIGVVLPPGLDAVTVVTALVLGGRVPVVIDVGLADEPGDLAAVMEEAGVRTVITRVAVRAALPGFPWPDHVLDVQGELEEPDSLGQAMDLAAAWVAPGVVMGWMLPEPRGTGGCGGIYREGGRVCCAVLSGEELMMQTEMLRGTDVMREGERLLNVEGMATPLGYVAGLWGPLLRGIPLMLMPRVVSGEARERALGQHLPSVVVGSAELAMAGLRHQVVGDGGETGEGAGFQRSRCHAPAEAGGIVAVSMPDPAMLTSTAEPQAGWRAGSCGRLLTGVQCVVGEDGGMELRLPGGRVLVMPEGARVDEERFLFLPGR